MWHPLFGLDKQYDEATNTLYDPVLQYIKTLPKGVLGSLQTQLLLRSKYEEIYGIRSHEAIDPNVPYPFAAINPLEDYSKHRPSYERIDRFIEERVATLTGMSLKEFLELPRHILERVLESCVKINQKENKQADQLSDNFNNLTKSIHSKASQKIALPPNYDKG